MATTPPLAPRPGPPDEQTSSRTLHPLYHALDARNFAKALKLTAPSSSSSSSASGVPSGHPSGWDIVRALRSHALDRSGRTREALVLLWEILARNVVFEEGTKKGEAWGELRDRMACLSDATDVVHDAVGLEVRVVDAVERLDRRAYAPLVPPERTPLVAAAAAPSAASNKAKSSKGKKGKGRPGKKGATTAASSTSNAAPSAMYPPVTDETVLATIAVTLRSEGLSDTLSEMYHQAMTALASSNMGSHADKENVRSVLEEGVCVHFRAVCDCPAVGSVVDETCLKGEDGLDAQDILQAQLPRLQTLLERTKYCERMQAASLQLAKLSAEPLHFQWTAASSLWYRESLQELVLTLERVQSLLSNEECDDVATAQLQKYLLAMTGLPSASDITTHCQKLKQKMALLPRLAESLSSRMVLQTERAVSESDWDVYLETLLVQDKKAEALEALQQIEGTPLRSEGNGDGNGRNGPSGGTGLPQIDDEHTIETHVGSILPYTQRKKLERTATLSLEVGRRAEAEGRYRELLGAFPDQWTYWTALLESSVLTGPSENRCGAIDEEGWERCRALADELSGDAGETHPLRGPRLMLLELASVKLRHINATAINSEGKEGLLSSLREEICTYGDKFGPLASCCFADIRPYLRELVQAASSGESGPGDVPDNVLTILKWAQQLWTTNSQSSDASAGSNGGDVSHDDSRERRKKLRTYIFAVQVIHAIAAEVDGLTMQLLQTYAPSTSEMATEWRTSLSFLPGVAPKDGGQKEVLPGDEIALLTSQYLQFQAAATPSNASATPFHLRAAGLLEEAMDHSPYNPHLKIAAIGVYAQLNAAHRALSIYQDMGAKQIQLDSCTYLILPTLIRGGLYTSAIKLSTSLMRLHGSTSKDIKDFASKALRNGYMFKAKEMVTFQTAKMMPSLQLLQCKGIVMDAAALMLPADLVSDDLDGANEKAKSPLVSLGMEKGFNGSDEDLARSEQLAIDAEMHFNAPSIIHSAAALASVDSFVASDNRDMSVNHFEILHQKSHPTQKEVVAASLRRGHMHGLLVKAIMATGAATGPKKGKIPKPSEDSKYRCQSLRQCLSNAKEFGQGVELEAVHRHLWDACCQLCEAIVSIIQGTDNKSTDDTLAEREKAVTSIIDTTTQIIESSRTAFLSCGSSEGQNDSSVAGSLACQLLPDCIAPFYVLLETTARLFSLFGWGKRKRMTKAAAGALANLALSFRDLVSDMLRSMSEYRSFGKEKESLALESSTDNAAGLEVEMDAIHRVIGEVASSRDMTKDRVDPFLIQIKASLETYDEQ